MKQAITITDAAAGRIKALLAKAEEGQDVQGIRLSVKTKGCSGNSYEVEYAKGPQPGDEIVQDKGVTIYIDAMALFKIIGSEMDYTEDQFKAGFEFKNPNETGRCGCGESFTT